MCEGGREGALHVSGRDVGSRHFAGGAVVGEAEFGGDHHFAAAIGEGAAKQFLGLANAIDVGGIEQSGAEVEGEVQGAEGGRVVDLPQPAAWPSSLNVPPMAQQPTPMRGMRRPFQSVMRLTGRPPAWRGGRGP
jgi:hypothetical protein